ncbi:MAG: hypothetical protein WBM83_05260 [Flavobacteriaceae bacterium]
MKTSKVYLLDPSAAVLIQTDANIAFLHKRRRSAVKKQLAFHIRKNDIKVA